ncbi:MAG: lipopolysaccharide biosynthesis protein [Planctomycetota bacterium]|nr:lipopolysaccharide biosynthesis protein [Planctomycetota bacterium]
MTAAAVPSPFSTDHLKQGMGARTVRGGFLTLGSQLARLVIQMGSTVVLGRLLFPADFGLVAMVATVTGFAMLFRDLGLSAATIQRDQITHEDVNTLFWINVGVGLVLTLALAAASPLVAWVYSEPALVPITAACAITMLFGAAAAQHTALLRRQMKFRSLAKIEVAGAMVGAAAAITLAFLGAGVWALVAMTVLQPFTIMVGSWLASPWRPGAPPRRRAGAGEGARSMVGFGAYLTGFNTLNYITRNFDNVAIGAALGSAALGIYSKAYGLLLLPIRQINGPIASVALPVLSRLQSEPDRFRAYYAKGIEIVAFLTMPIVGLAFVEADRLALLLLGPQWGQVADVFRWLAPGAIVSSLNVVPGWLYSALGRTKLMWRWGLWAAPISAAAYLAGLPWGITGVAAAFSVSYTALFIAQIPFACRGTCVPASLVFARLWRPVAAMLIAIGLTFGCMQLLPLEDLSLLGDRAARFGVPLFGYPIVIALVATAATIFTLAYFGALAVLPGGRSLLASVADAVRSAYKKRASKGKPSNVQEHSPGNDPGNPVPEAPVREAPVRGAPVSGASAANDPG